MKIRNDKQRTMTPPQQRHEIDMARLKELREFIAHSDVLDLSTAEIEKYKDELAQIEDEWDNFNEYQAN